MLLVTALGIIGTVGNSRALTLNEHAFFTSFVSFNLTTAHGFVGVFALI